MNFIGRFERSGRNYFKAQREGGVNDWPVVGRFTSSCTFWTDETSSAAALILRMVEMLSLNYRRRPPPPDPPVVEGINLRELYIEYAGVRTGNQHGSKRMEKISRCRSRGAVTLVEVFCLMSQMICFTELILPSLWSCARLWVNAYQILSVRAFYSET